MDQSTRRAQNNEHGIRGKDSLSISAAALAEF